MAPVAHPALLPAGFTDLLPPHAAQEAALTHSITQLFQQHGYARIQPPLLEFEDNLLAGAGTSLAPHTFRLMDPLSGQMLGLRADMTVQVARIATTRIADWPRPLRLAYAGQVVRQSSGEQQPERQSGQIGLELIGSASPAADAEIIMLACASLTAIGITAFTLDLSLPTLVTGLCRAHGLPVGATAALRHALDRKDQAAVAALGGRCCACCARPVTRQRPHRVGLARTADAAAARAAGGGMRASCRCLEHSSRPGLRRADDARSGRISWL